MRNSSSPNEPSPLLGRMGMGPLRMPGKVEKARDARGTVAQLWGYLKQQRSALIITAVLGSSALP